LTAHALPAILTAAVRIGAQSASSVTVRLPHGVQRSSRTGCINMRRPNTRTFCSGLCFRCALYHSPYHADAFFRRRAIWYSFLCVAPAVTPPRSWRVARPKCTS